MKVLDLAKKLNTTTKLVLDTIQQLGNNEITHHMQTIPNELVEEVEDKFKKNEVKHKDARNLYGINTPDHNPFSVLIMTYTGGNFDKKIESIAKDLKVSPSQLLMTLKQHGYPVVEREYIEDIKRKSEALIKLRRLLANSSLYNYEER